MIYEEPVFLTSTTSSSSELSMHGMWPSFPGGLIIGIHRHVSYPSHGEVATDNEISSNCDTFQICVILQSHSYIFLCF